MGKHSSNTAPQTDGAKPLVLPVSSQAGQSLAPHILFFLARHLAICVLPPQLLYQCSSALFLVLDCDCLLAGSYMLSCC